MNLSELLKGARKESFNQREVTNLSRFLGANVKNVEFYKVNEWNGDTYVIMKWPHKVPGLVILP
jgi:hypothetical protein